MSKERTVDARVFLFDTSHHAMWAEDVAGEQEVPAEVIPAPPEADAKCGVALRVPAENADDLRATFDGEGIPYTVLDGD